MLGIDAISKQVAVRSADGSRRYFSPDEWKGSFPVQPGMRVDYDVGADSLARNVFPIDKNLSQANSSKAPKTKTAATLMAFFLGGLGLHKFYLGAWGWGVIYLVFCWTYIPLLFAIIETVRYITLSEDEFQEKYAKLDGKPFDFLW